jgi:hypothetical protein
MSRTPPESVNYCRISHSNTTDMSCRVYFDERPDAAGSSAAHRSRSRYALGPATSFLPAGLARQLNRLVERSARQSDHSALGIIEALESTNSPLESTTPTEQGRFEEMMFSPRSCLG